ncbi:MAG: AAA family ATPase [Paracoccaceae bacterium]
MKNDPITLGSLGVSYCPSTTVYLWPRAPAPLSSCSTPRLSHLLGDVAIAGLAEASKAMKQSAMDKLTELTIPQIILGETEKPIFETVNLQQEVVLEILQKSATSSAVERLRKNPALAAWVEGGRELHAHSEDGKCEYCLQIIPEEREAELAAHFNASDAKLKREIERAIGDNKAAYEKVARMSGLSEKALYPEFRTDFLIYSGLLSEEQTKILNHLEALRKALEDKLAKRTESYNAEFPSLSGNDWHKALFLSTICSDATMLRPTIFKSGLTITSQRSKRTFLVLQTTK